MSNQAPTKATPLNNAVADVATTFSAGDVPRNEQITRVIDEATTLVDSKKKEAPINEKGKVIAEEMKEVLQSAKTMVLEKNPDESLQKIVTAAQGAAKEVSTSASLDEAAAVTDEAVARAGYITAKGGIATAADVAKTANVFLRLGTDLVTWREFRLLLVEFLDLLQEGVQTANVKLQQGLEKTAQTLESTKQELQSTESPKTQAKRLAEAAGDTVGKAVAEGGKAAIDVADSAQKTISELREGKISASDLIPMSDERKEQFRLRFNALLDRIGANPDYRASFDNIFKTLEQLRQLWFSTLEKAQTQVVQQAKSEIQASPNLQTLYDEGFKFIGRFVKQQSIDSFIADLKELYSTISEDPKLSAWWTDLKSYVQYALDHPREAITPERTAQLNSLLDRAFEFQLQYRYSTLTRRVLREGRILVEEIKNDATTNQLVTSFRNLAHTLFLDKRGNVTYKPEELRQFKILFSSILMEELKYIPVPKIEGSTDEYDFTLQNVMLYGYDLLPDHILLKFENKLDLNLEALQADVARSNLSIKITHMKTHMKNVMFWFRKKTGLIKFEDHGLADVDIAGDGATLTIQIQIDANDPRGMIIRQVDFDLDKLNIHVIDSRYDWLLNLFSGIIGNSMKRSIEREVESRMTTMLQQIFSNLSSITSSLPVGEVGGVVKENLKDLQATKRALEVDPKTRPLSGV